MRTNLSRAGPAILVLVLVAPDNLAHGVQQTPVFKTGVSLVTVDVLVRDREGKPVDGLTAADFEIYDQGRRQSIATFAYVSRPVPDPQPLPRGLGVPLADVATNSAMARSGRAFVFVVDPAFPIPLYEQTMKNLFELVTPDDLAAVVFPHRSDLSEDFTSDPARLARTMDRLIDAATTGNGLKYSLDALENAFVALEPLPRWRKAIVWITSGYAVELVPETRTPGPDAIGGLDIAGHKKLALDRSRAGDAFFMFEKARQAGIPIYTIDPVGITEMNVRTEFLKTTALVTGALSFVNRPYMLEATRELMADNSHFYVLGYVPDPMVTDGRFKEIEVRLPRHRDFRIRAKEGYVAKPPTPPVANPTTAMTQDLAAARSRTDLAVWAFAAPLTSGGMRNRAKVLLTTVVRYPDTPDNQAVADDELRVQVLALDPDAHVRTSAERRLRVPAAARRSDAGVVLNEVFELSQGPTVFRVGATSTATGGSGTLSLSVDVPVYSPNRPGLTQLVLGVAGQPPGAQFNLVTDLMPFQASLQRRFSRDSTLRVFSRVFGLNRNRPGAQPTLTLTFHGTIVRVLNPTMTPSRDGIPSAHDIVTEVPLKELARGQHVLRLTITPPNHKPLARSVQIYVD